MSTRISISTALLLPLVVACGPSAVEERAVADVSGALGTLTGLLAQRWHELSAAAADPSSDAFRENRLRLLVDDEVEWAREMEGRLPEAPPASLAAPVRSIRQSLGKIRARAEALRTAVAEPSTTEPLLRERVRQADRDMVQGFCAIHAALTTLRTVAPERFTAMQDETAFRALRCH